MEIKKFIFVFGLVLFFIGCTTGNCRSHEIKKEQSEGPKPLKENNLIPAPNSLEKVKVFKSDGTLQCDKGKKIDIEKMKSELRGVKIYQSYSENDGVLRMQVCGAPTGNSHIFEIDRENLSQALSLGFKEWIKN